MSESPEKQTEFDRYAPSYSDLIRDPVRERFAASDRFFAERKVQVIRDFLRRASIETQNMDWLDVGCGQGDLLRLGQQYFKSASGCDPSEGMLESCAGLDVRLQSSSESLPYEDRRFDFITFVCVYHHVPPERRAALTIEACRLLRPNGVLCVVEHNPWNPVTKRIVSRTPVDADAKLLTALEARELITSSGLRSIGRRFFLFLPEELHRRLPRLEDMFGQLPIGGQYAVFGQQTVMPLS